MIARYALAYAATGIAFIAIDAVWLRTMAPTFYRGAIGSLLADQPRLGAAAAFYLVYAAGIVLFAVAPAFAHPGGSWKTALGYGAALGFVAYATYDLTNQATLKVWPLRLTLVDLAWGTLLTGAAAAIGYLVTRAILKG
ncbi:MAG TPA: DUF2177 family protein [Allosphingosinicella sp.]|nr:DUF2177 family protein [Allosphingosinicella sp.]